MKKYSVLLVILGSILWGTDSLFRRPLSRELSPITIVFLEHCVLCAVMIPVLYRTRSDLLRLTLRDWLYLLFIAVGGSVAATSLFTYSIKYGNPSVTVLLQKTQPLLTVLLARWQLGEKPGRWFWFCLPAALWGAYLVSASNWRAGLSLDMRQPLSIVAALGAALLWGCCTVFGRYVAVRMPALILTGLRFALALPVLMALFILQPSEMRHVPSTISSVSAVVAMALIPGLAALLLYYKGLQTTLASVASVGELAFPVTAVAANWLVLDIRLAGVQVMGGAILVASVTGLTYMDLKEKSRVARTAG